MLPADELKRRIEAARILRNVTQVQLAAALHEDGLGKHDLGRIERGDMVMRRIHLDAFTRHLGVPERWFTIGDVDEIVGLREQELTQASELLARRLREAGLEVQRAREQDEPAPDAPDRATGSQGGGR